MLREKLESIVQHKKSIERNGNENYKKKELYYTINMKLCFGYISTVKFSTRLQRYLILEVGKTKESNKNIPYMQ